MSNIHHQIVIIGAGTAGITVAAQLLRKNKKLDIALIDPAAKHYYQPAWTLVGAGTYQYKNTERDMKDYIPDGAAWLQKAVKDVDPDKNELVTEDGTTITYDYLVACPGIQIDLDGIEGLKDTIDKNEVCSNYTDPDYTWKVLQEFKGGRALFTQAATPIKCGGAPQKIMYLADDYWQKAGVKKDTSVLYAMPGSTIFGVPDFRKTLMKVIDRKDIGLRYFHKLTKIDYENKKAYYTITNHVGIPEKLIYNDKAEFGVEQISDTEVVIPYDMMHLAPPQSAPDFIKRSKLAHQEGPSKGWIDVHKYTLIHNKYPNVFALGDSAALPTAKTGAAVRKQAPVVVENLLEVMKHQQELTGKYEGYSSCPLVTGYGKMVLAEFKYDNVRDSDPMISKFVDTAKENWSMWMLKKYGLPYMYWNLMLRGKA